MQIKSYQLQDNEIICNGSIHISLDAFADYLTKNDLLYYESHDFSTGQYVSRSSQIPIDEYFDIADKNLII